MEDQLNNWSPITGSLVPSSPSYIIKFNWLIQLLFLWGHFPAFCTPLWLWIQANQLLVIFFQMEMLWISLTLHDAQASEISRKLCCIWVFLMPHRWMLCRLWGNETSNSRSRLQEFKVCLQCYPNRWTYKWIMSFWKGTKWILAFSFRNFLQGIIYYYYFIVWIISQERNNVDLYIKYKYILWYTDVMSF